MDAKTLEPWRWYLQVDDPPFHLDHWWLKPTISADQKRQTDENHPLLVKGDPRRRPQIQVAPWLWEILRRHPQFRPILETFRSRVGSYPDLACLDPEAATSALDVWLANRGEFLRCWEGRGAASIGALAEFGHLSWADLHPGPKVGDSSNELGTDPLDDVLGIPLAVRRAVRATFEFGLQEFLRNPDNYCEGAKPLTCAAISVPLRPSETDCLQYYYRNRQDFGIKNLDDFTLGEFRKSAGRRSRSLLFLEFDEGASVEVLTKAIHDHLKTVRTVKPGQAGSKQPSMRLNYSSLELLALLDSWSPSMMNPKHQLSAPELKRVIGNFSKFKLA